MMKIIVILLLLTGSIFAQKLTLKTTKNEFIILHHDNGNIDFVNKKFHRKNVLLFLFGKDCPHCQKEVPKIRELAFRKDIALIGLHAQKDIGDDALRDYMTQVGYTFDMLSFSTDVKMLHLLKRQGLWTGGVPAFILINKQGNIAQMSLKEVLEQL